MRRSFGHVDKMSDERMAKKTYEERVSGKRNGRERARLIFKNTILMLLQESPVHEAKEVCRDCLSYCLTDRQTDKKFFL